MLGSTRNTFIAYLALVLAVSAVQANTDFHRAQRDHVNLKRFVKKRAPQLIPVIGAGRDPAEADPSSSSVAVASSLSVSASATSTLSASPSATNIVSGILSITGVLSGSQSASLSQSASVSASSSSSVSSSVSTSSSASSTPTTSAQQASETLNLVPAPVTSGHSAKPTVTLFTTQDAAAQETEIPKPTGAAQTKSMTLMILIIIASSVGGVAIFWTIFRKWKLGRSSKFDERLQPIDWQPTDDRDNADNGIIPAHRRVPSNASSFHSASAHGHPSGNRGNSGGALNLQPIPDHDFTAGVAPIGGYADLARGPSPPMGEVNRGVGLGRGYEYDTGVPLHHQAGGNYGAYDYQGSRY